MTACQGSRVTTGFDGVARAETLMFCWDFGYMINSRHGQAITFTYLFFFQLLIHAPLQRPLKLGMDEQLYAAEYYRRIYYICAYYTHVCVFITSMYIYIYIHIILLGVTPLSKPMMFYNQRDQIQWSSREILFSVRYSHNTVCIRGYMALKEKYSLPPQTPSCQLHARTRCAM